MSWTRKRLGSLLGAVVLAASMTGCLASSKAQPGECAAPADNTRLSIATGNTTGVYYILGGGMASVLTDHLDGAVMNAEATAASVENIHLVCKGDSDIAMSLGDTAAAAVEGSGAFEDDAKPVRALARTYVDVTHVMVRSSADIESVADLAGKRVSTGSPNSGTEQIAERLLRINGVDPEGDIDRQRLPTSESVDAMKDGALDAIIHVGTFPHPGMQDLAASMGGDVTLLDIRDSLEPLNEKYDKVYVPVTIPEDAYSRGRDIDVFGVPTMLLVSKSMPDDQAYEITKTLFEHRDELVQVHPAAEAMTPEASVKTGVVPLHPGAQRYFSEAQN